MVDAIILGGYSIIESSTRSAGMIIVANIFRQHGLTAQIIDHLLAIPEDKLTLILKRYVSDQTKFVCVSTTLLGPPKELWSSMHAVDDLFEPIFNQLKQLAPNAKFIIGGSLLKDYEPSRLQFDYAIRGQAEKTLPAVINKELYGHDLDLDSDGYVSDKIYDYQDFYCDTLLKITAHEGVNSEETLPIEMARGCVFRCAYCTFDMTGKRFGDYTKTENTLRDILISNYEQFGTTRYQFADEILNDSQEKIDQLLGVVHSLPFELEFGCYIRLELCEKYPDSVKLLLDAGLRGVNIGVETLNRQAGQTVGKGYGLRALDTLDAVKKVWQDHVAIQINLILGLPHETEQTLRDQHKLFVNSNLVDHIFYHALVIPKKSDSAFSQGLYHKYYLDLATDPEYDSLLESLRSIAPSIPEQISSHVHWQSRTDPDLNYIKCQHLQAEFYANWAAQKPFMVNNLTSMAVLSLREFYTMQEMRTKPLSGIIGQQAQLQQYNRQRIQQHVNFLLHNKLEHQRSVPTNLDPVLATRNPFRPKILDITPI